MEENNCKFMRQLEPQEHRSRSGTRVTSIDECKFIVRILPHCNKRTFDEFTDYKNFA